MKENEELRGINEAVQAPPFFPSHVADRPVAACQGKGGRQQKGKQAWHKEGMQKNVERDCPFF